MAMFCMEHPRQFLGTPDGSLRMN